MKFCDKSDCTMFALCEGCQKIATFFMGAFEKLDLAITEAIVTGWEASAAMGASREAAAAFWPAYGAAKKEQIALVLQGMMAEGANALPPPPPPEGVPAVEVPPSDGAPQMDPSGEEKPKKPRSKKSSKKAASSKPALPALPSPAPAEEPSLLGGSGGGILVNGAAASPQGDS